MRGPLLLRGEVAHLRNPIVCFPAGAEPTLCHELVHAQAAALTLALRLGLLLLLFLQVLLLLLLLVCGFHICCASRDRGSSQRGQRAWLQRGQG